MPEHRSDGQQNGRNGRQLTAASRQRRWRDSASLELPAIAAETSAITSALAIQDSRSRSLDARPDDTLLFGRPIRCFNRLTVRFGPPLGNRASAANDCRAAACAGRPAGPAMAQLWPRPAGLAPATGEILEYRRNTGDSI